MLQELLKKWQEYKRHKIGLTQEDSDRPNLYFDDFMDWIEEEESKKVDAAFYIKPKE